MNTRLHPQLTFDVRPHPGIEVDGDAPELALLAGYLKISGGLHCPVDVHAGDQLTVTVADADGTVIAQGRLEAGAPKFGVIEEKGIPIGMDRTTTGKVQL